MAFINEVVTHKFRTWKSVTMCMLFLGLGLICSLPGPTILDLRVLVGASLEQITLILPVKSAGNMVGAILCGFILPYFDHQLVLTSCILVMSITFSLIPFCQNLMHLFTTISINGISTGFLVNTGNVWIIHMWGKENAPFMQTAHFAFGFGAFFAPFLAEPFLLEERTIELSQNSTDVKIEIPIDRADLKIKYAYWLVAAINFLIFVVFLATFLSKPGNKPHPTREVKNKQIQEVDMSKIDTCELSKDEKKIIESKGVKEMTSLHKTILVLLASIFIHFCYGIELSFGSLLATFAVKCDLHLSKSTASYMTSVYWGCFTFCRLITIILVNFFSSRSMLILDLVFIMLGNFVLLPLANQNEWAIWVGTSLIGIGVSSIYPTLWGYMETIMPVTSKMTSIVTVFACVGEFILPVAIGYFIESWPMFYLYVIFIYSLMACVAFGFCFFWERVINKHKNS